MAPKNKLELTNSADLIRKEEQISKKKAMGFFESGILNQIKPRKFSSLPAIHKYPFDEICNL